MTCAKRLPLFKRFPDLENQIPWLSLGEFPTPVHSLDHLDLPNLWIKRDDLTSPVYGGNKVRKLEFILADAKRKNNRSIVTFGGIGTNHGLATAIYCQRLGINCRLLLFEQPITRCVKQNLSLFHHFGAEVSMKGPLWKTVLSYYLTARLKYHRDYFLFAGGSSVIGTLGYVNAAFELKDQIDSGQLPEPETIFCPVGSNGTMAGLLLGTLLAGLNTKVIGIRVSASHLGPFQACTHSTIKNLAKKTWAFLRRHCLSLPEFTLGEPIMDGRYLGDGYGYPTKIGQKAFELLNQKENIALDPCYTAKTFAAVIDSYQKNGGSEKPILYWHTYNSRDLSADASSVDPASLPPGIQRIMETDEVGF